jgi:hypothetical protein
MRRNGDDLAVVRHQRDVLAAQRRLAERCLRKRRGRIR